MPTRLLRRRAEAEGPRWAFGVVPAERFELLLNKSGRSANRGVCSKARVQFVYMSLFGEAKSYRLIQRDVTIAREGDGASSSQSVFARGLSRTRFTIRARMADATRSRRAKLVCTWPTNE